MAKVQDEHVQFDRNGVASVRAVDLLRDAKVKEQYSAARRVVEAQKAARSAAARRRLGGRR